MPEPVVSRKKKAKNAWYNNGLQFECTQCGKCCSGAPGFIWVSEEDITLIAERLNISEEDFKKEYLYQSRGKLSLKERDNGDCILLDEKTRSCMAYDLRPVQCRTWPWWDQNLKNEAAWEKCKEECDGIGRGRKHTSSYITSELEKDRKAEK
ncbi:MAG: YkgJ family cysteine cluster protein [Planctomycetota bacterium]